MQVYRNQRREVNISRILLHAHDDEKCYCKETLQHLSENEQKYYIDIHKNDQKLIDNLKRCAFHQYRHSLIEWLILIQGYYSSSEETLEMSIRLFDYIFFKELYPNTDNRVFRCMCGGFHNGWLRLNELQLIALTCFFLSCKFWERFPPKLSKLLNLSEFVYSEQQLLDKEKEILSIIKFDLKIPLITQHLEFYLLHETNFLLSRVKPFRIAYAQLIEKFCLRLFSISKTIPVCHYLYNLTLTEPRFLKRTASSLAAAILTLTKMLLCSFSACDVSEIKFIIHDKSLFRSEHFMETLIDLWNVFTSSITNRESFRFQKRKFSDEKYNFLYLFIEQLDLDFVRQHFLELLSIINM